MMEIETELDRIKKENDTLRGLLAKGDRDCVHCGLAANDIAKCVSGFPGCARMDDIICAHDTKVEDQLYNAGIDINDLKNALGDFIDDDQCSYDYHGYCQTHGAIGTTLCPMAVARKLLGLPDRSGK